MEIKIKVSAYIDPGTGGMILTSIWSYIAVIFAGIGAFFLKYFFRPIKERILKTWNLIKNIRQ